MESWQNVRDPPARAAKIAAQRDISMTVEQVDNREVDDMVEDEAGETARAEAGKPSAKKKAKKSYPCTQKVTNPTCTHLSVFAPFVPPYHRTIGNILIMVFHRDQNAEAAQKNCESALPASKR